MIIGEADGTAFCREHELIEPFQIVGFPKVPAIDMLAYSREGAVSVTAEFTCGHESNLIVAKARV